MLFLGNQKKLFITFYSSINGQTKKQNSIIKPYLPAFINYKQNNWAKLYSITEFVYNNIKNTSMDHTFLNSITIIIPTFPIKKSSITNSNHN